MSRSRASATMRETRIAAALRHPHIVSIFDVVLEDGEPRLVLEFLPSRSLGCVLAEHGTLPPVGVAAIGADVAAAHAAGAVHCDVKPDNVLLSRPSAAGPVVKLTDFAIADTTAGPAITATRAHRHPGLLRAPDRHRTTNGHRDLHPRSSHPGSRLSQDTTQLTTGDSNERNQAADRGRKGALAFTMSLDGFVAGPNHEMDWMTGANRPGLEDEYVTTTGTVLGGRDGWDIAAASGGRPYGGGREGPIFVLTHHPEDATQAAGVTFLNCDPAEAVRIGDLDGGCKLRAEGPHADAGC